MPRSGISKSRPIVEEKLRIPDLKNAITRPRLIDMLERAEAHAGATVLCGRAGTGKTLVAAEFAAKHRNPVWYSLEPADTNWESFKNYLTAAIFGKAIADQPLDQDADGASDPASITEFLARCMDSLRRDSTFQHRLVVLDNIHHLYDAQWFHDFFNQLVVSLVPKVHFLMLCRTKPQLPLWRFRSKQMLNVIDENVLAITPSETVRLCRIRGVHGDRIADAVSHSNGRISKVIDSIRQV